MQNQRIRNNILIDTIINPNYYMSINEYNHIGGDKLDLIEIFKALGDENRIRILNLLIRQELCVCEIETVLDMTQSNASRHLNKLKTSGIITSEKKSQWVYYRVDNDFIKENDLLYEFIKNKLAENTQLQRDIERLKKYKNSNFTCEQLREDKSQVLKYLREQCKNN
jgi:ArsR family transcriptional regulator